MPDPRTRTSSADPQGGVRLASVGMVAIGVGPLIALVPQDTSDLVLPISLVWMFVWLGLASISLRERLDKSNPLAWALTAMLVMYVAHPAMLARLGLVDSAYHYKYSVAPTYERAIWAGCLATLMLILGYWATGLRSHNRPTASISLDEDAHRVRLARIAHRGGWALAIIALGGYALYARSFGISPIDAILNGAQRVAAGESTAYLYLTPQLLGPATLLLLYARWLRGSGGASVLLLVGVQAALFAPTGQRFVLMTSLIPVVLAWAHQRGWRIGPVRFAVFAGVALVAIIAMRDLSDAGAGAFVDSVQSTVQDPSDSITDLLTGADTEMVDGLAIEMQIVPDQLEQRPGWTLWTTLAAPVPGVLWSGKPTTADGILNYNLFAINFNNASVAYGFAGELFFDGGLVAITVGFLLVGSACGWLRAWIRRRPTELAYLVFAATVPLFVALLRGSLALTLGRALFTTVPVLLFYLLATRAVRRAEVHDRALPAGRPERVRQKA